eukprot:6188513-Pleurochrysis_carterae.AAC.5
MSTSRQTDRLPLAAATLSLPTDSGASDARRRLQSEHVVLQRRRALRHLLALAQEAGRHLGAVLFDTGEAACTPGACTTRMHELHAICESTSYLQ